MRWANFDNTTGLLVFHCKECNQSVEVDVGTKDEELLPDSRSRSSCIPG